MKEQTTPLVHNQYAMIQELFQKNVMPTYGRFDLVLDHGAGSYVWDVNGRRYLDFGGGIAVDCLGHGHPAITQALTEQSKKLMHVSNLYFTEPQGRLAQILVNLTGPGKVFFCNSGAEANEGLYKVARKYGHKEGRFEILTAFNSFHGRTLAGIAATGQEKVKKGFEPAVPGFRHVPFNEIKAIRDEISPATVAVLIEGIQGETGVNPAKVDYLLELREFCTEKEILLLIDDVQGGMFRTGRFASYQRLLEDVPGGEKFLPDGISWAKSLGGGFPIGAFWVRQEYGDLLSPGTHGTTYGGTPLGCAVAIKVIETIQREGLDKNARELGNYLKKALENLQEKMPGILKEVRGTGLMIGMELQPDIPYLLKSERTHSLQMIDALHRAGLMAIPSSTHVIRLLPALNLQKHEADEGLRIIEEVVQAMAG